MGSLCGNDTLQVHLQWPRQVQVGRADEQWQTYLWTCLENTCLAWKPKVSFIVCDATSSAGMAYGMSPLTCDNSEEWPKRASNPRCCSLPVTLSGGMAYSTLALTSDNPEEWTKEVKCKHCCLWPCQWAWSMVTQHLPVMTQKNGRRGKLHVSLPGCWHGSLRCRHEQRGLMAKQKNDMHLWAHHPSPHAPPPIGLLALLWCLVGL